MSIYFIFVHVKSGMDFTPGSGSISQANQRPPEAEAAAEFQGKPNGWLVPAGPPDVTNVKTSKDHVHLVSMLIGANSISADAKGIQP